ncbi:MAG: 3-isopropylmalate dehydrogenase [Spirochaetaceae bacterium]|nr:3-isopropylmalate dehydrogenase [Spirochaetaceae bacterium]
MENTYNITVLPGDGIGPEVMAEAMKVLDKIKASFKVDCRTQAADFGGIAIDNHGSALPESTLSLCKKSDAVLLGSIGGPKWETLPPEQQPERAALLPIRKELGLFANLRPAVIFPQLSAASPLKDEILENGMDVLVVRELTGGIYFGSPKLRDGDKALDTLIYTKPEIERISHVAFKAAKQRKGKVTSIDKANVLTSMVLWREVVNEVSKKYPEVELSHMYVDNGAMQLVKNPNQFDVILCGNMFGDILSDEASMITGSLGMLPSASLGKGNFGLYEPSGGSAPDIAGKGIANPIAQILSLGMMFKYSFDRNDIHEAVFKAIEQVLEKGYRTKDILTSRCQEVSTSEMGTLITNLLT